MDGSAEAAWKRAEDEWCSEVRVLLARPLDRLLARLAGADANRVAPVRETKILPSPIWPVWAVRDDGVEHGLQALVGHGDFDLDLGHEIDVVFGAAIHFRVPLLAAEAA